MYLIKRASEISGVSVRTLQYYDKIGLLRPMKQENGYRYYTEEDMSLLQMILYYKYLGFNLKDISTMINQNKSEILGNFKKQLLLMNEEKERLLTLIDTLEKTIESMEREMDMKVEDKFKGFKYEDSLRYKGEAIEKYGEVVEESYKRQRGREEEIAGIFNDIFLGFAGNASRGIDAINDENIKLAERLHKHIIDVAFDCSLEVFSKIGYGYVCDDEFKKNIDKFGKGTAQYVCDAIQEYVKIANL